MAVEWSYYNKQELKDIEETYLPARGEGESMASQIVTATAKLVYKWYNDGDVFDNTGFMTGWCNNLSSYANWLHKYVEGTASSLDGIHDCSSDSDYEDLLKELVDLTNTVEFLQEYHEPKQGSIYNCDGPFVFKEDCEEDDEW